MIDRTKLVDKITQRSCNYAFDQIESNDRGQLDLAKSDLEGHMRIHYTELLKWAFDIPFIGLSQGKEVDTTTIELNISSKISKFGNDNSEISVSERQLLSNSKNVILLGKPGAGKTTTVKRLINLFLFDENSDLPFNTAILIKLRERKKKSLVLELLGIFNFTPKIEKIKEHVRREFKDGGFRDSLMTTTVTTINGVDISPESFLVSLLDSLNATLFLDGFDEISVVDQKNIMGEIRSLGMKLSKSKIILTSRTSTINNKILGGFDIYELQPLNSEDVKIISKKWLGDNFKFLSDLYSKSYQELANRPVYLTLLLVLFEKTQALPVQPFEIYRDAVYLIIRDWDEKREIERGSNYADFNIYKKLSFLQDIAFNLTYKIQTNVFTTRDLVTIYEKIYDRYNLPSSDVMSVIAEIESHNGLITESGPNTFEFSHLTLQEYLCAEYLSRIPFSQEIVTYFFERPDPLAITICISNDPDLWFSNLLLSDSLNIEKVRGEQRFESSLYKLLSRLIDESPVFNRSVELGLTMIYLVSKFQKKDSMLDLIMKFSELKNVARSVAVALESFQIDYRHIRGEVYLKREKVINTMSYIRIPHSERIDIAVWQRFDAAFLSR